MKRYLICKNGTIFKPSIGIIIGYVDKIDNKYVYYTSAIKEEHKTNKININKCCEIDAECNLTNVQRITNETISKS